MNQEEHIMLIAKSSSSSSLCDYSDAYILVKGKITITVIIMRKQQEVYGNILEMNQTII